MIGSAILAFENAEHAGGVEHAGLIDASDWLPAVTALAVFLIAFVFLYIKVWPMIIKGLDDREAKIRHEIESAEQAREQAKAALAEYQQSLAHARDEANAMIAKARSDAKMAAEELRTKNQADITEMKQRATREIESAKQAAISSLYQEASSLAVSIAGKILEREISPNDQKRMIDDSLHELARAGKG